MKRCVHNHPVLFQWDRSRWPEETSDSLGTCSCTICNLQKAERDGQNQYRPAVRQVCGESEQTPCGKRDPAAPITARENQPPPRMCQSLYRHWPTKPGSHRLRLSPTVLGRRRECLHLWMSAGCSNPPGDSYKPHRDGGVRGVTAQLREGNASPGGGCVTQWNQLYPKHGERDPECPSPRRVGNRPREHPQGGMSGLHPAPPAGNAAVAVGLMAAE